MRRLDISRPHRRDYRRYFNRVITKGRDQNPAAWNAERVAGTSDSLEG
jgi:hypothetical protein